MKNETTVRLNLEPDNTANLANLCGQLDGHLRLIEKRLGIRIQNRGNQFMLKGEINTAHIAADILRKLYLDASSGTQLTPELVHLSLQPSSLDQTRASLQSTIHNNRDNQHMENTPPKPPAANPESTAAADPELESHLTPQPPATPFSTIRTRKLLVKSRGANQQIYLRNIHQQDINFGIGPAGTGKTYLAVACAVEALEKEEIQRILLVRPAVEAGEKLGFLPGDLSQKIDPYLRPLYDALYEMLGFDRVSRLIERSIIEIAPLAYMRGRTLNNAFVILDESQNTTKEQMKMFLTRIGYGSAAVITGDITQVDLPKGTQSGLRHAMHVLDGVEGIGFTHFTSKDVVRHPLVQRIVEAYEHHDANLASSSRSAETRPSQPAKKTGDSHS